METMDQYSSVCAAQSPWLATRTEVLGVGWVGISNEDRLPEALGIPAALQTLHAKTREQCSFPQ
ncbi:MAG: hypothetical protein EKK46_17910 [Rhodocyclaceae bacterium]|nr:MAG: hypothetical protein EKK46_17910 [Rhodocyclaceae bacterium]